MTSIFSFTSKVDLVDDHLAAHVNALQGAVDVLSGSPQGVMFNGKLDISVSGNAITVAIKTLAGTDPSVSDPVIIRIDNTLRMLTEALNKTLTSGTNWFNSGGTRFATKEVDYFVYLIWDTVPSTDELDIGISRMPYAITTNDFSFTTTNERYVATNNASGATVNNKCEVIGRFNAILSATAAFNWSLPATQIIINRPIFHTRILTWVPALTGYSADPTTTAYRYMVDRNLCKVWFSEGGNGTSNATTLTSNSPFTPTTLTNGTWVGLGAGFDNGVRLATPVRCNISSGVATINFYPTMADNAAWTNVNGKRIQVAYIEYTLD